MKAIHRDAHPQPFANLGKAVNNYFKTMKNHEEAHTPQFKKKGKMHDSFYLANDKFQLDGKRIKRPKVGWVNAIVSRQTDRWFVSIQVEVASHCAIRKRKAHHIEGADVGIKTAVALSTGEGIRSPKPLQKALRKLKIRQRHVSHKLEAAKKQAGITGAIPKGTILLVSNNRRRASMEIAKLHMRMANIRSDFTHKTTTRLVSENQAIGMENLHVNGMTKNHKLALALSDVGFGEFRRQVEYKAKFYKTTGALADRFYPSSKKCSVCDYVLPKLELKIREWNGPQCGTHHDRDTNAARNLKRLATTAIGWTALSVANQPAMVDTSLRVTETLAMVGK